MGKNLGLRIKRNSEEFYRLYQEGKKLGLANNILAFLLLSAIEEMSKYFIEVLISKCDDPKLRKNVRSRIYNEHIIKYEFFLAFYYIMQSFDVSTMLEMIKRLASKWINIRKRYLINVSYVEVKSEDLTEIENYYLNHEEIENAILELNRDESCDILNTLVNIIGRK
ncbi:hypothetical protein [Saccharolobus caldissimus]|uniref:Uncharacterized protein n=1 Tax=Saccharolobus caldissimus TaxID=1702097 RepID=A0AAQ4CUV2_9CREN|nr:hypothetical protein [Saccharolobus caldissimus]BDB99583.1 hypothetical protein SACC_26000 [Saccharolobus caldissimus]